MIRKLADRSTENRSSMRGGTGTVTVSHFFKTEEITAKTRLCANLTIPPGASIGAHQHNGEDEVYIVTRGTGLLDDGKSITQVAAGDAILTGNGESHSISNNGTTDLEIIAVIMCYA
jgi:mannose-6-phosphate isomerase-like protein (cupin superfamily)